MGVGQAAAAPFAVQVLGSDGVTPVAGKAVSFTASAGHAQFGACGGAACQVVTDGNGVASTPVTPTVAGAVTLQASGDEMAVSASFSAVREAGSMITVTAPSGSVPVGVAASVAFQVKVLGADGKTAVAGQLVTFTVTAGSATYSGCFGSVCSVVTNAAGMAQVGVTPSAAGPVTLEASDGALVQQALFVATANANELLLVSAPQASVAVNQNAGYFIVRLVRADGVTPVRGATVVLSGPVSAYLGTCRSNVCVLQTANDGSTGSWVSSKLAGSVTLQAVSGDASISATFEAVAPLPTRLSIVSAPTGVVNVGTMAPAPFTAQLLRGDGTPFVGAIIQMGAPVGSVLMNCRYQPCQYTSDSSGRVTSPVTPLVPGTSC